MTSEPFPISILRERGLATAVALLFLNNSFLVNLWFNISICGVNLNSSDILGGRSWLEEFWEVVARLKT
jgi:hypothetical protein